MTSMLRSAREILRYRTLLATLVQRDLKVRYKRSVLGVVWTMLNPLLMMIVFSIVFANIFRFTFEHFTIYFLSAFLLWNFVAQTTSWATACLLAQAPLIRKIYVPKAIFILATVLSGLVNLLVSLVPLALIMLVVRHPIRPSVLFLPVPILLATLFAFGVSLLLAGICIEFNDVVQIYQVAVLAWMYLTPIIYPLEVVPEHYRWIIRANPMYYLVEVFRAPIYRGVVPDAATVIPAVVSGVVALAVGWWVFERRSNRIAYLV
jgi:ABC-type polysaccharide/polyol phosphate export permease